MKKSPNSEKSWTDSSLPTDSAPSFIEIKERVRYSETDRMGIAHNKNYFEWFEIGRTEFCRQKGIPYAAIEEAGFYLVVVEAFCRYKKALHYDDYFRIRVRLRETTGKKIIFDYELFSAEGKNLIASGYTVHIATDKNARVIQLPETILEKIRS